MLGKISRDLGNCQICFFLWYDRLLNENWKRSQRAFGTSTEMQSHFRSKIQMVRIRPIETKLSSQRPPASVEVSFWFLRLFVHRLSYKKFKIQLKPRSLSSRVFCTRQVIWYKFWMLKLQNNPFTFFQDSWFIIWAVFKHR